MRLADLLIDLAAVANASRSVASKHVALRARQLDRYGRTSSFAQRAPKQPQQPTSDESSPASPVPQPHGEEQVEAATAKVVSDTAQARGTEAPELSSVQGAARSTKTENLVPESALETSSGTGGDSQPPRSSSSSAAPASQGFTPAPWGREGGIPPPFKPPQRMPEVATPVRAENVDLGELPEGINLSIFHTSRGSRILELLKEETENPSQKPPAGPVDEQATQASVEGFKAGDLNTQSDYSSSSPATPEESSAKQVAGLETDSTGQNDKPLASNASQKQEPTTGESRTEPLQTSESTREALADPSKAEERLSKEDQELLGGFADTSSQPVPYQLRESKVPASRLGRLWNYGGLAAGMLGGTITEGFSRALGGGGQGSMMLSPANMERLVAKLSRMRGAALKLGQMMSFQDSKMLPAPIQEVLQRVQDRADYMPAWQRDRVLVTNLGAEWRELFEEFEEKPIAAASIGQVHRAKLKSNGAEVAVKIQFPGVADSINSDLDNLGILLTATRLLPKGLYLNKTIDNARVELAWECDYEREATCAQKYRELLVGEEAVFLVPKIYPEACGKQVLTMEFMEGVGVTKVKSFTQEQKDWIGTQILRLCLREITEFKFMQTDPNWSNFLFNAETHKLELLDFGASREYPDKFIIPYFKLLQAASQSDREGVRELSTELGYLTGHESKAMLDAHVSSILTLAEPFMASAPDVYDFQDQTITERVKSQIPVMIRERLSPPPEETYSLHRKLSGAFLLCARLGSKVPCKELFADAVQKAGTIAKSD